MFTAATVPEARSVLPRPSYPESSRTLQHADSRTRQLAAAMVRLNGECMGGATEEALLREGFSRPELRHHADAARALANQGFVRQVAEQAARATLKSDEELLAIAYDRCGGLVDVGQIVAALRGGRLPTGRPGPEGGTDFVFSHDTIARLWPKLCAKLARRVALLPIPPAMGTRAVGLGQSEGQKMGEPLRETTAHTGAV